ncbi:hypothetical protein D3C80_680990 [compost metagenome]
MARVGPAPRHSRQTGFKPARRCRDPQQPARALRLLGRQVTQPAAQRFGTGHGGRQGVSRECRQGGEQAGKKPIACAAGGTKAQAAGVIQVPVLFGAHQHTAVGCAYLAHARYQAASAGGLT